MIMRMIINAKDNTDYYALEYMRCKKNPFYFIYNYIEIPEIGSSLRLTDETTHSKMKRVIRCVVKFHRVVLMASRQKGKALNINTPIPMAAGYYKFLEDINVGDYILDENKKPTRVIAMTDIMYGRTCYNIKIYKTNSLNFEEVIADEEHLWKVDGKIVTTKELFNINQTSARSLGSDCYIQEITETKSVPVKCIQVSNSTGMFLCGKLNIPTHNSTIAAAILLWAANFYPGLPIIILNMRQLAALENLNKIKFMHSKLPKWMASPVKGKAEKKTYFELSNGSIIRTFYPLIEGGFY